MPGEIEQEESKNLIRHCSSHTKVVRMLIAIVAGFLVCWLPLQVASLLYSYQNMNISELLHFAITVAIIVASPCQFILSVDLLWQIF